MGLNVHIVVCGHSLYLDAIAATLQSVPGILVTQLHARPGLVERVIALAPDALIVERAGMDAALQQTLSTFLPTMPVIEVDALQGVLTFPAAWETPLSCLEDLLRIRAIPASPTELPHSCDKTQMLRVGY